MRSQMKLAYRLISEFRQGLLPAGSTVTDDQSELIRLLSADLAVKSDGINLEQLIQLVSRADSHWNKRTMAAIDRFYAFREAGNAVEAERERQAFIGECPSVWYCGILSSL